MVISSCPNGLSKSSRSGLARSKPAACRNLFGKAKPEEKWEERRRFRAMQNQKLDQMNQKYNFDFRTYRPLEGRYRWELVSRPNNTRSSDNFTVDVVLNGTTTDSATNECESKVTSLCSSSVESEIDSGISSDNSFMSTPDQGQGHSRTNSLSSSSFSAPNHSTSVFAASSSVTSPSTSTPLVPPPRRRNINPQMTDFFPVCKSARLSKRENENFM